MSQRKRDHKAEYRARVERAKAKGYSSYKEQRRARAEGQPKPGDTAGRRQVIPTADGGSKVRPTKGGRGEGVMNSQLGKAAGKGQRVHLNATLPDGRKVQVFGKGGWSAAKFRAAVAKYGSVQAAVAHFLADLYGGDASDYSDVSDFDLGFS